MGRPRTTAAQILAQELWLDVWVPRLILWRLSRGLSLRRAAPIFNVSAWTLHRWETRQFSAERKSKLLVERLVGTQEATIEWIPPPPKLAEWVPPPLRPVIKKGFTGRPSGRPPGQFSAAKGRRRLRAGEQHDQSHHDR